LSTTQPGDRGFFATLFDFSFTSFITLKFMKVIYAIAVGLILLVGAIFFLAMLVRGGGSTLLAIVGVPVVTMAYLVLVRLSFELVAQFFRIGEHVRLIAQQAGQTPTPSTGGWPAGGEPAGE
jgi:cellulose synthase/poly-beta-1,6-N-acetylglucosamine synthase-like glycosyltransferase